MTPSTSDDPGQQDARVRPDALSTAQGEPPSVAIELAAAHSLALHPGLVVLVGIGGMCGTALRYGASRIAPTSEGRWPVGTFVVNLLGAFILGLLLEAIVRRGEEKARSRQLRLFLGTGFCGGLTTYSTLAVEVDLLVRHGQTGLAVAYGLASVVAGLVLTVAGIAAAAHRHRPHPAVGT